MAIRIPSLLVLATLAFACMPGCEKAAPPTSGTPAPVTPTPATTTFTIGYSQCNRGEPWREQMDKDIERNAAKEPSIKLLMKDAQNDALAQQGHVKEYISQKIDLLIISPKDSSLTQTVAEAYDAGIPVIVLDRAVEGDKYTCFIGADNRVIGKAVGEWVVQRLAGKGAIVELKGLGSSIPAADRSEPFREVVLKAGHAIVYEADMEWLGDKAREKMQAALALHREKNSIQLVYGANDPAAIAAYYAAKDAGREGEILFVGVDALPHEGIEAVKNGLLAATFEYPNGTDVAIATAMRILKGETVEKKIVLGTRLFTKDNLPSGGEAVK
ncbi:MAG: substrate-binding domain-containing protein [Phycisphaerae bacterium]|jgi:ribose transport system substrate-binding protein|nr:substrate-binding domain-containing protein [Phycisphaerae bacterium]